MFLIFFFFFFFSCKKETYLIWRMSPNTQLSWGCHDKAIFTSGGFFREEEAAQTQAGSKPQTQLSRKLMHKRSQTDIYVAVMCLDILVEQSRFSNQDSSPTSIWKPLSLCFPSEVSTLFFPPSQQLKTMHTLCIDRDIPPLPEQTQIYLCTLLVESLHLLCTPVESGKAPSSSLD